MKVRLWLIVYIMSSGEQRDIRSAAETLYRNAQQPYAGPSRYGLYWIFFLRCLIKWYSVQDLNFKLYLLSEVINFIMFYIFFRVARPNPNAHLDLLSFVHEDYIAGYTQDGQMSTVRRFFCLFVIFDLFFISMLWFICIMVSKKWPKNGNLSL